MVLQAQRCKEVTFDVDIGTKVSLGEPQRVLPEDQVADGLRGEKPKREAIIHCSALWGAYFKRLAPPETHRKAKGEILKHPLQERGRQLSSAEGFTRSKGFGPG
jgi:hypothetical protein